MIEREEVVALLFNVSDLVVGVKTIVRPRREMKVAKKKRKLTEAERKELNAFLDQMEANALRTRELAERAQAKLDAKSGA